jgi:predicted AlkP superfamily phosphohydrolase/phosphomutase
VSPPEWEERVLALLAEEGAPGGWRDPFRHNRDLPRGADLEDLSEAFRTDAAVTRAALAIEAATRPRLLMVFLKGIDRVSHRLFPALEPPEQIPPSLRLGPAERDAAAEALRAYYAYTDALIGLLAERFAAGDLVMVVSDHGFETRVRRGVLRGEHRSASAEDGVVFARGRGIRAGARSDGMSVLDVTPTLLAWLGLPVADDMDGAPAGFLEAGRVARIATYESKPVARGAAAPSQLEPEILEELRELGYFEE